MIEQYVEQSYNGSWYLVSYAPFQPLEELKQEKLNQLKQAREDFKKTTITNNIMPDYTNSTSFLKNVITYINKNSCCVLTGYASGAISLAEISPNSDMSNAISIGRIGNSTSTCTLFIPANWYIRTNNSITDFVGKIYPLIGA